MNKTPTKNEYSMTEKEKRDFKIKIATFRQDAKLSARQLSLRLEMADGYINRLEMQNSHLPSFEVFMMIIKACGVTAEQFFYHDRQHYESDMKILKIFHELSDENRDHFIALFEDLLK